MATETKELQDLSILTAAGVRAGANEQQVNGRGWMVMKSDGTPLKKEAVVAGSKLALPMLKSAVDALAATDEGKAFLAAHDVTVIDVDADALAKGKNPFAEKDAEEKAKADAKEKADKEKSSTKKSEDEPTDVAKAMESLPQAVREMVAKSLADAEAAREEVRKERDLRLNREWVGKAKDLYPTLPVESERLGAVLRSIDEKLSPEDAAEVNRLFKSAADSGVFAAMAKASGTGGTAAPADAQAEVLAKADDLVKAKVAKSLGAAIEVVLEQDPALARRYQERR